MGEEWLHQVRIYLADEWVEAARRDPDGPGLEALAGALHRHQTILVSQLDAFEHYVAEAEAQGPEDFPLYRWTKATVADPVKRARYAATFTLRVRGDEVYPKAAADALEAELLPLVGAGVITRLSRHDTNPANNPQVPPQYRA